MPLLKTAALTFCAFCLVSCAAPPEATLSENPAIQEAIVPPPAPSEQQQVMPSKTKEQKTVKKNPCRKLDLAPPSTLKCRDGTRFKIAFTQDNLWACITFLPSGETAKLKGQAIAAGIEYSNKDWLFHEFDHKAILTPTRVGSDKNQCRDISKKTEHKAAE